MNIRVTSATLQRLRSLSFGLGIALLVLSVLICLALLLGLYRLPTEIIAGESSVHSIARIAIVGCLLAFIGSQH